MSSAIIDSSKFLSDPVFKVVSEVSASTGVRAFVIGGYVRDCFLGRNNDDIDIVVEGSGTEFAQAVASYIDQVYYPEQGITSKKPTKVSVFENFGTAMLHFRGMEVEFVGARKESYHRESRKPIVESGTLEDDQKRRDFTINAMAFSLCKEDYGALVDPFGGISDLAQGIIRTPLDPEVTFSDDPLRMFRAARFATKLSTPEFCFTIVPECLTAMREMADRISILSKERIVEELCKILAEDCPSIGLKILDETTLLEKVLPQVTRLKGVETVEGRGHKDNFSHTLQVVDYLASSEKEAIAEGLLKDYYPAQDGQSTVGTVRTSPNVWLRWAGLLHDIGKPVCKRFDPVSGWTFHGHEVVGSRMVAKVFRDLKMPQNEKMKYVEKLVGLHHRPVALVDDQVTDSAVRRLIFDAGDDLDDLMLLCNADITSKNPVKVKRLRHNFDLVKEKLKDVEQRDAIRNWKNPITGDYIMEVYGIEPCNTIGFIKERIKEAILDGKIGYTFEEADSMMREIATEYGLSPKDAPKQ